MEAAEHFRAAVEKGELAVLDDLFTEDIRLYSPVKFIPFEGKPMALGLFGVLLRTLEDFRYIGHFEGAAETSTDGEEVPSVVLPFRATLHGKQIHGIDLLQFDEMGRIKEFTVMVRPSPLCTPWARRYLPAWSPTASSPSPPSGRGATRRERLAPHPKTRSEWLRR